MAKITWLGEDHLHGEGGGPRFNVWNGVRFEVGKPVDTSDEYMIGKAKGNPFYSVEDGQEMTNSDMVVKRGPGRPPKVREE